MFAFQIYNGQSNQEENLRYFSATILLYYFINKPNLERLAILYLTKVTQWIL